MNYSKLKKLPLGSIIANGFLKDQLLRSKHGMGGHLPEIEPGMIADPYLRKTIVHQWEDGNQEGWGAEISGNYYTGLILLAYTLNDDELKEKSEKWVNGVLERARPDGYLGTFRESGNIYDDYNAWGTSCGMRALLYYYEATGRKDVFDAVYNCMLWFCKNWEGDHKTSYCGVYITYPMMYCYERTGDSRLLEFCIDYQEYLNNHDLSNTSMNALLNNELIYQSFHTAGYGNVAYMPALIYRSNGKKEYLKASERGLELIRKITHPTGGPVSAAEFLAPISSIAESEYCSFTFFNTAYASLAEITGKSLYGDYMEQIVYNAAQGAKRKDEKAIAYLSAPNQMYATTTSSPIMHNMQVYSPCYPVSCCPVNSVIIVPEYVDSMIMADSDDNLYFVAYGPCTVQYNDKHIEVKTMYPFKNDITVTADAKGIMYFKKPFWAKSIEINVDGNSAVIVSEENGYTGIQLPESGHCEINVHFEAVPEIIVIDDSDCGNKQPIAFRYGALIFSLPIEEKWKEFYPETETPLSEDWPWYSIEPAYEPGKGKDGHEEVMNRSLNFSWNVAVDENLNLDDIKINIEESDGYVWSSPQISLTVPAYMAPYAYPRYPAANTDWFTDRQIVTEKKTIKLVPYGCTNLRLTYFPRARL